MSVLDIDWEAWEAETHAMRRVVPAEDLAEEGKRRLLLGSEREEGLTFPWSKFSDKVLIRPGKLALWVGWSHHGKSSILQQLMLYAIQASECVAIASMEEEMHDVWCNMGRMACGRDDPSPREIDAWVNFVTGRLWFYDQQGAVNPTRIKAVIRYCAQELKITHFVVDSLMMLSVSRDDYDAQSVFVGDLKTLAKDTGCTVHLVAHMRKRDGKTGEEQAGGTHDIAGGHEIASKADYIFNVWRDKLRKDTSKAACVLGVDKQRGRTNWLGGVGLSYHARSRQFVDDAYSVPMRFWGDQPI